VSGVDEKLDLTQELHTIERLPSALFAARVLERGLQQIATGNWATASRSLDLIETPIHHVRGEGTEHVLAECDGTLVQLGLFSGWQVVTAEEGSAFWSAGRLASARTGQ